MGEKDVLLILAQYDSDGAMVKMDAKSVTVGVGFDEIVALSATAEVTAASAKLYVWSGSSLDDAGESILANAIAVTK